MSLVNSKEVRVQSNSGLRSGSVKIPEICSMLYLHVRGQFKCALHQCWRAAAVHLKEIIRI